MLSWNGTKRILSANFISCFIVEFLFLLWKLCNMIIMADSFWANVLLRLNNGNKNKVLVTIKTDRCVWKAQIDRSGLYLQSKQKCQLTPFYCNTGRLCLLMLTFTNLEYTAKNTLHAQNNCNSSDSDMQSKLGTQNYVHEVSRWIKMTYQKLCLWIWYGFWSCLNTNYEGKTKCCTL